MLFTCLPKRAYPGTLSGPAHARGKWFTVDIHCHVRSVKAAAMVDGNEAVSRWFLETAANERSQEINRQNGVRTTVQGIRPSSASPTWTRWASTSRRSRRRRGRPITVPTRSRAGHRARDQRRDRRDVGRYPDRFTGLGTIPLQAPELAIAELDRLHNSLGFRGIEIMTHVAGEDLSADVSARSSARTTNWDCWCSCTRTASPRRGGSRTITSPM